MRLRVRIPPPRICSTIRVQMVTCLFNSLGLRIVNYVTFSFALSVQTGNSLTKLPLLVAGLGRKGLLTSLIHRAASCSPLFLPVYSSGMRWQSCVAAW